MTVTIQRAARKWANGAAIAAIALGTAPAFAEDGESADTDSTVDTIAQSQADIDPQALPAEGSPPIDLDDTVFDENWVTVGVGVGLGASYSGSDDYVVNPLPLVRGRLGPVRLAPRPGGLALDFLPKSRDGVNFELGPVVRLRNDRATQIEDEVVKLAGELDTAVELGVASGISVAGVLNPYDSLSFGVDARWDVAGAHEGMVIESGVNYFTPVSRGAAVMLGISAQVIDDDYADYYYTVSPAQSAATGLPEFAAEGGLNSIGANLLVAIDLDGDIANGGFGIFAIGGYSRLMGDGKDTPYTSIRGSADQYFGGVGVGYTF
ncbi:MipA/OmpV family protein [Qipengyuania nanhaisediminis]|uniref:MipA/OmpV family protein n=1 Tax=Qipengyuania nanhaisediminis TaxID=604088 RepID=UPI0038B38F8C